MLDERVMREGRVLSRAQAYSYGLHSYGLYSYGLDSDGPYSYGSYSYD